MSEEIKGRTNEQTYNLVEIKRLPNGGTLSIMDSLNKKSNDYNDILTIGRFFAEQGKQVQILGKIHYKNADYQKYFGGLVHTEYYKKCPDLKVGDKFYEYESYVKPWNKRKISNMLSHGLRQSNNIIINNNKGASDRIIRKAIMARLFLQKEINEVWLYEKGKCRLFYKNKIFYKNNGKP